jgi:hypothetical protein
MPSISRNNWITLFIIIFIGVISLGTYQIMRSNTFADQTWTFTTFWTSFIVGSLGAVVYLGLLIMTEKNLNVLQNDVLHDTYLMALLFVFSGGFVAAITQTSAGRLTAGALQSVFLLGFGWQGALTGVAASSTRVKINEDFQETYTNDTLNLETIIAVQESKINELDRALREAIGV